MSVSVSFLYYRHFCCVKPTSISAGLFPFLLQIIEPDSPKLEKVLKDIQDPGKLWTNFGLRSLSREATLYNKKNTEHDPPYWRGPVWINVNFLAVRALHFYATEARGPYQVIIQFKETFNTLLLIIGVYLQAQALNVYKKLRKNLVDNVMKQYEKTGYIWEQYNDKTGKGQGCRPFTGWSALVVLMMGENY